MCTRHCAQCTAFQTPQPPPLCRICSDERQYVGWQGQAWTTHDELATTHHNRLAMDEALFGIGIAPKIILAGGFVFFIVFMNLIAGIESVNRSHVDIVRVMGGGRMTILRKIVLPTAVPFLFLGLRLAIPEAMIGAVIAGFAITQATATWINALPRGLKNPSNSLTAASCASCQ